MSLIGYARVSTQDQDTALQTDALEKVGCIEIFRDKCSGSAKDRPGLSQAMRFIRQGDTLVVWRLDRLGRSLSHLVHLVESLEEKGVGFRSLTEAIDTTTSGGKLIFNIMASLAQFERDLIRERTKAGLEAAKARGTKSGRPPAMTPVKFKQAKDLVAKGVSISFAAKAIGVSRSTLYNALKAQKGEGNV